MIEIKEHTVYAPSAFCIPGVVSGSYNVPIYTIKVTVTTAASTGIKPGSEVVKNAIKSPTPERGNK